MRRTEEVEGDASGHRDTRSRLGRFNATTWHCRSRLLTSDFFSSYTDFSSRQQGRSFRASFTTFPFRLPHYKQTMPFRHENHSACLIINRLCPSGTKITDNSNSYIIITYAGLIESDYYACVLFTVTFFQKRSCSFVSGPIRSICITGKKNQKCSFAGLRSISCVQLPLCCWARKSQVFAISGGKRAVPGLNLLPFGKPRKSRASCDSMMPSTTMCATCTFLGPYSRAIDWHIARKPDSAGSKRTEECQRERLYGATNRGSCWAGPLTYCLQQNRQNLPCRGWRKWRQSQEGSRLDRAPP